MSPSPSGTRTRILLALLTVLALFAPVTAAAARSAPSAALPAVSPIPQSMRATGTDTTVNGIAAVVTGPGSDAAATSTVITTLRRTGAHIVRLKAGATIPANARLAVYVGGPTENTDSGPALTRLGATGPAGLPAQGYVLADGPDGSRFDAVLAGVDPAGTFYATQTFGQLVHSVHGRWQLPGVIVRDQPAVAKRGIIEGFYGAPWTAADRTAMLRFAGAHKMNSYVYAPKLDPYERTLWRDPYPAAELKQLGALVSTARDNHVDFTYAVSPGLTICFSDAGDFAALEKKTQSMYDLGVRSFALFFDDIAPTLGCAADKAKFGTDASPTAAAQAYLLNEFQQKFIAAHPGTEPLVTVPTEYSGLTADPYKKRLAALVDPAVHMYWTGPVVVSATISDAYLTAARALYGHPLEVWDNFPVNDFLPDRLFLGPVSGRGTKLAADGVTGFVANPMIEAAPSQLPLATTADMTWNSAAYNPQTSWAAALNDVGGRAAGALRTFADNNLSSALSSTESPDLAPGITAFEKAFAGGTSGASGPLTGQFERLAAAIPAIRRTLPGRFTAEAGPWLAKSEAYGTGGAAAVRTLTAQLKGDDTTAWRQRVILDRSIKAANSYTVTVGENILDPFLTWAQQHADQVVLAAPAPGAVLKPGSDITLSATVRHGNVGIRSVRFYAGADLVGTATRAPYNVVWHNAPRRVAQIVVRATDDTGATIESSPVNLTIGAPDQALFVVNDATMPIPGEQVVAQRLGYLGMAVTTETASKVTAASATGKALVVISPTVVSTQLQGKLAAVAVPIVVSKSYLYGYLGMAKAWGDAYGAQQAAFTPSPLSAGLTGTENVYRQPDTLAWGSGVAPSATVGATVPGASGEDLLFGYDRGAAMVSGTAPARRVGMYLSDDALLPTQVVPATLRVFDAAIGWALGGR